MLLICALWEPQQLMKACGRHWKIFSCKNKKKCLNSMRLAMYFTAPPYLRAETPLTFSKAIG